MLRNPGNLQAGRNYARSLIAAGNYEGGIAALEGMLADPAADPSLRVELAVLYYRLGSYAAAESYLRTALADQRLPANVRTDAQNLLADVERRNAPGGHLTGNLSIGGRFQSNPTAAADSNILANGASVPLPDASRRNSAFDAFLTGNAVHEWDLNTQNSATLVTTGNLFANHYEGAADYNSTSPKTDPQDLAALNVTSGIRFKPDPVGLSGLTTRPYLAASELLLDGNQYMGALGGGVDADYLFNDGGTLVGATYDIRRTMYAERADITDSNEQSGYDQFLQLRAMQEVGVRKTVTANVTLRDHSTDREAFDYQSVDVRLIFGTYYTDPFGWDQRSWATSLYAGPTFRRYGGADPSVTAATTREDTEWRIGVSQFFPVAEDLGLQLVAEYTSADSNLPNYTYDNASVLASVVWNF
ncbi:MAG TPA: porin family protein [Alphaproteobacteria bacterium]